MRYELKIVSEEYEEVQEINIALNASKLYCALHDVREAIRQRLKHYEVTEEEESFLEELRELTSIEVLD